MLSYMLHACVERYCCRDFDERSFSFSTYVKVFKDSFTASFAHDYKANTTTKEDQSSPHRHFGRNLQDSRTLSCDVTPNHSKIKREPARYQYLYPSHLPKDSIDLFDTKRVAMSKTIIPDNKPRTIKNGLLTDKEKHLLSDYMCFVLEQLQVCQIKFKS